MAKKDYYEVLGLNKSADKNDVTRAYRKLALKFHPDRNPDNKDAEEKFKEATEAYEILVDENKRHQYDTYGFVGEGGSGGFEGYDMEFDMSDAMKIFMNAFGNRGFGSFGGFNDDSIFSMFSGGGGSSRSKRRGGSQPGEDLQYHLEISLEDAALGTRETILIPRMVSCSECQGKGYADEAKYSTCSSCNGTGELRKISRTLFGQMINVSSCGKCKGVGEKLENPCKGCKGAGRTKKRNNISIELPAGVDTGSYLRIPGKGNDGLQGGSSGDLIVMVRIKEHDFFHRRAEDIVIELPVTFSQLALGTKIKVPTVLEPMELKIPAGSQPHDVLVMKNAGMPKMRGKGRGKQHVRLNLKIPKKFTLREKKLLKDLHTKEASFRKELTKDYSKYLRT